MRLDLEVDVAPLLERDVELDAIRTSVSAACGGRGSLTLFEGHAGTGKSRLLQEAAAAAEAAGMRVLHARGDELEREFAFGVVLGLLEDAVRSAEPEERSRILVGAARLAEPLFAGSWSATAPRDPQGLYSLVHGLYWVTQSLADVGPLLLLVDDAQWGTSRRCASWPTWPRGSPTCRWR